MRLAGSRGLVVGESVCAALAAPLTSPGPFSSVRGCWAFESLGRGGNGADLTLVYDFLMEYGATLTLLAQWCTRCIQVLRTPATSRVNRCKTYRYEQVRRGGVGHVTYGARAGSGGLS